MLIHLSAPEFDIDGSVSIDVLPSSEFGDTTRRVNRTATLDGGAAVNDYGYSEADRTIKLRWKVYSREQEAQVVRLVQLYGELRISTHEGLFRAAPETYRNTALESSLSLLVMEKLT